MWQHSLNNPRRPACSAKGGGGARGFSLLFFALLPLSCLSFGLGFPKFFRDYETGFERVSRDVKEGRKCRARPGCEKSSRIPRVGTRALAPREICPFVTQLSNRLGDTLLCCIFILFFLSFSSFFFGSKGGGRRVGRWSVIAFRVINRKCLCAPTEMGFCCFHFFSSSFMG